MYIDIIIYNIFNTIKNRWGKHSASLKLPKSTNISSQQNVHSAQFWSHLQKTTK